MLPNQAESNMNNPEEHVAWALRSLPTIAGTGSVTNPMFLKAWSKHLVECGFAHRDYLASLADENGYIHVSQLPEQRIKYQDPIRGQYHHYNNASRWVPMDAPDPKPSVIPDVRKYTIQEQNAIKHMLIETGVVKEPTPQRDTARVTNL
jgi:Protein of unknown function (DUF2744)